MKKGLRLQYNAPVVLSFALLSFGDRKSVV